MYQKVVFLPIETAVANHSGAMESGDHLKNGASPKKQNNRGNFSRKMKRIITKAAFVAFAFKLSFVAAYAQAGDKAFGGNLLIAGDETTLFGIGAKFQYNITDPIRLEGSFSYCFPKKETQSVMGIPIESSINMWNLSVNGQYLLPISEKVTLYPLAGLGITGLKAKASAFGYSNSDSENYFGFNLGGGLDFKITETILLNFEARNMFISDGGIFFLRGGLVFKF